MLPPGLADPQTDPAATYAVDPAVAHRLVRRIVAGPENASVTTRTPFSGAPIAVLPVSTPDDVRVAADAARAVGREWAARPRAARARAFLALHDLVLAHQGELLDLIQIESGKARAHAFEEVADVAIVARHYARRADAYLRPRRRQGTFPVLSRAHELRHPKGVVGIIAPWNYPLTLAVSDAIPALIAGNAVVLKPDTQCALTALAALELFTRAGVPEGLVQVVVGEGPVVGAAVVDNADYVCFTGSTRTGRVVAERAARRLVGVSLELGGKNALYVAADADLDRAAEGAVRACFSSAGQLCVATERMLLHRDIAEEFLDRFLGRVRAMRLGSALDYSVDCGSLVSQQQLDVVTAHVLDARSRGAVVLTGGRPRPDIGPFFYEPTVLEGVRPGMTCYADETFGPVVSVYRVGSDEEAVALANDGEYGLSASIWTRDVARGRRLAVRIRAGAVNVNEGYAAAWGSVGAPMGGMRHSGLGRRHGGEGIWRFTESQNVTVQRLMGFGAPPALGHERWARALTLALQAMRRAGVR